MPLGFGNMDARHGANAELGRCDRLATTDDAFFKQAMRCADPLHVKVVNPVHLIAEDDFV